MTSGAYACLKISFFAAIPAYLNEIKSSEVKTLMPGSSSQVETYK